MAYITINRQNYFHNLNQIALKVGSVDKIAVVLKDNAYGHGLAIMAGLASEFGIKHAVIKDDGEAKQIVHLFETVLVLGGTIEGNEACSYVLNSLEDIARAPRGTKVELKVDTGMHRNGIDPKQLDDALGSIEKQGLELVGVMTHYRSADELSSELFWQQKNFETIKEKVRSSGYTNVRFHGNNSAATLRAKKFDEDLVRVGIAIYGYNELPAVYDEVLLKPVLSLWAKRIASHDMVAGERIGYGGDFAVTESMRVSTYDLGYGDGWIRGNSAHSYITAENLSILGRVSMDYISLASDRDEICIMNDAQDAAKQFGTISYEVTTMLSPAIERIVLV